MKAKYALTALLAACFFVSCSARDPFISKKTHGNLQVEVTFQGEKPDAAPSLTVDDRPMGHLSPERPVLHLKEGKHHVKVTCPGYETWEKEIYIAGDPNHQYLEVRLQPKQE